MTSGTTSSEDRRWMMECLRLAAKGEGRVSPNPLVGAVLVSASRQLASGYHRSFGGHHAEVHCLRGVTRIPPEAVLYVNLEPCSHYGKTPPCTDMIIRSGVRNVVVGMRDPNPLVSGRGIAALRREGINVRTGVMREACADLNRFFVKQMTTGLPFVHLKMAQTLDGKIGLPKQRLQITGPASRRLVHRWRAAHDAVLVGAGTITADDPQLTVRMARGRDPHVVILDGHLRSPASSRIFRQSSGRKIIVCTTIATVQNKRASVHALETAGAVILSLPGAGGHLPLKRVLRALSGYGIGSLLVEGGANVFGQFIRAGLVDQCSVFVSPAVIGNGIALPVSRFHRPVNLARRLPVVSTRVIDQDILIQYFSRQR